MRLLLVHQGFPPERSGGSEIYTAALARRLARDHEVTVLHGSTDAARPDYDLSWSRENGPRLVSLNNPHPARGGFESYADPGAAAAAAGVMEAVAPDLVHIGNLAGLSTGIVFEARRRGVPVAITLHDFWPVCPLGQLVNRQLQVCPGPAPRRCLRCVGEQVAAPPAVGRLARGLPGAARAGRALSRFAPAGPRRLARRLAAMHEVLRAADLLISPSAFLRDRLAALGVAGITVLENGHEPLAVPPRVPDPAGRVRFGFLGTAVPSKGVHVLAEAFRRLDDPRAALHIHGAFAPYHGDHGYEERVRAALGPHAAETLRGPVAVANVPQVLAGLDVMVVPSLWEENAPLVVQEAFLAKLPLVVSDHGGLAERVRQGVDGLRFRPGDAAELCAAMRRLVEEPELRARLGSTPPPVPSMDEHVRALEELYAGARSRYCTRAGRVGVVVLDAGRPVETARAVASIREPGLEPVVLVVENGPGEVPGLPAGVEFLRLGENRGYAAGMNEGIAYLRRAGCDRFLLLNNDAVLEPGCLRALAEALEDPALAAAGPVILREADGRVESRGARFDPAWGRYRLLGHGGAAGAAEGLAQVAVLSGAVWMLSGAALERIGPIEESYFWSFEDVEWCLRARRAGLGLAVVLGARARHGGSRTLGAASPDRLYYAARNHLWVAGQAWPRRAPGRWIRHAAILAWNLAHALRQRQARRGAAVAAVLRGARDFSRGRLGP
ncbi:MAG TPA: glycosyltransferase, partial [Vicinamibacteria bacterium]